MTAPRNRLPPKTRAALRESLDETHHKTGSNDGGKDRDENITDGLQSLSPDRCLCSCRRFDVILRAGRNTGDRDEFIKDLVDGAGADDQLELSVGLEHALDAIDFLQSLLVDFPVIRDNETQSCRAVRGGDHVCAASDIIGDLLRTFTVIQCHNGFLPLWRQIRLSSRTVCEKVE